MSNKVLPSLLGIMIVAVGVIGYLVFGEYREYAENDSVETTSNDLSPLKRTATYIEEDEIEEFNNTSTSSNEVILKPTAKEVYDKAQSLFNKYTNYGDRYVPEIHDDLVIEETAEFFNISVSEANELYMEGAF